MNDFMSRQQVERIKQQYPMGTRIELIHMDDPYAPIESGTKGTVECVDDAGNIHLLWDNGRTLALVPNEDQFKIIKGTPDESMNKEQNMRGLGM
jgi:hypothetical protein